MKIKPHLQYLKYVLRHKWYVFIECLKLGVPLWIAIFHDWDKFLPDEWLPYTHTFYAPDGSKQYKETPKFARAWMYHQHRNKHHWQWWLNAGNTPLRYTSILVWDRGTVSWTNGEVTADWHGTISIREDMPDVYRRVRIIRGGGKTSQTFEPIKIPYSIKSAAIASYKNRAVQECIDSLGLAEYYD